MAKSSLLIGLLLFSGASLTACNASGDDAPEGDLTAAQSGGQEDQFSKEFRKSLRADPNSKPVDVTANSLPPVSYTDEPVPVD